MGLGTGTGATLIASLLLLAHLAQGDELPLPQPAPHPRPRSAPQPRLDTWGYRVGLAAGGHRAAVRVAGVADPTGPEIGEITLRGQLAWRQFGLAVEGSGGGAASEQWSDAGVGNASLELHGIFGGRSTHTLGLKGQLGSLARLDDPRGLIGWWGSVPSAMVPQKSVALVYAGGLARWVWKFEFGLGGSVLEPFPFVAAGGFATVQPLGGGWSVVGELEARYEASPVHARLLARKDLGRHLRLDVGVAVPFLAVGDDPTLQVVA